MPLIIGLFGCANLLDYLGHGKWVPLDLGINLGIALAVVLVSLIGGRIVPSFTRNWMQREQVDCKRPTQPNRFDHAVIFVTAASLLGWVIAGIGPCTAPLLLIAGLLQLLRLLRWSGWRTASSPIVLILHLAYLWIPAGLILLGSAGFGLPFSQSTGIHALTAGAMASMILAVMTRATLGHTGRALHADLLTKLCYVAIQFAAIVRVAASVWSDHFELLLHVAGGLWIAAFGLFSAAYGPKLVHQRGG